MIVNSLIGPKRDLSLASPAPWLTDALTGGPTGSGVAVNESTALNYSAVWAATRILSETIASLPLILYRRRSTGNGKDRAPDHPLYPLLHDEPNSEMDSFAFWATQVPFLVNWGNAYAEIQRSRMGRIVALWPLHAGYVTPFRGEDGRVAYEVRNYERPGQSAVVLSADRVFHLCGALSENGIAGRGVIRQARESIGMGLATEQFGATFFANGARPGGVLKHPGNPSEKAADAMRSGWAKMHQGSQNAHQIALLREGVEYQALGIAPEDAQFLGTRQFNVTEIARWYRVPPHLLGDLSKATFSNIEEQSLEFLVHSIRPWLVRVERAIQRQLIAQKGTFFTEFLLDALLRGDSATRTSALKEQFLNGAITLDEWRALENRNPIEGTGGDTHFVPMNMQPLDRALEEPEPPPPMEEPPEAPPETPEDAPETPVEDDVESDGQNGNGVPAATQAARDAYRESLTRFKAVEIRNIKRLAKTPERFLATVPDYYAGFQGKLLAGILPAVRVCHALEHGDTDAAEGVARAVVDTMLRQHEGELLAAAECLPQQLAEDVDAITQRW